MPPKKPAKQAGSAGHAGGRTTHSNAAQQAIKPSGGNPQSGNASQRSTSAKEKGMEDLQLRLSLLSFGETDQQLAVRPASGGSGIAEPSLTNYYQVEKPKFDAIYQYSIDIQPVPSSLRMRRRILYLMLHHTQYGMGKAATDYRQLLVTVERHDSNGESIQKPIDYYGEGENGPRQGVDTTVYTSPSHRLQTLPPSTCLLSSTTSRNEEMLP